MSYKFQVGDLVTIWTGGWDKHAQEKYEGRAGIIMRIASNSSKNAPTMCFINFGWGEVEISEKRLRLLTEQNE